MITEQTQTHQAVTETQTAVTASKDALAKAQAKRQEAELALRAAYQARDKAKAEIEGLKAIVRHRKKEVSEPTLGQVLDVKPGLSAPVAAALADGIKAVLTPSDGLAYWNAETPAPAPRFPQGVQNLTDTVVAPEWLKPLMGYFGLASDANQARALQKDLLLGSR